MTIPDDADSNPITGRPIHWPEPGPQGYVPQQSQLNESPMRIGGAVQKDGEYWVSVAISKPAIRALVDQIRALPDQDTALIKQLGRMLAAEYNRLNRMDREVGRRRGKGNPYGE